MFKQPTGMPEKENRQKTNNPKQNKQKIKIKMAELSATCK